jgi:hypothetical protein
VLEKAERVASMSASRRLDHTAVGRDRHPDPGHWRCTSGWNAGNFGWGADRTENILWRLENGEIDGVNPKVVVILAGTNNVGRSRRDNGDTKAAEITAFQAILNVRWAKAPATIIVTAFPATITWRSCSSSTSQRQPVGAVDGRSLRFLNINDKLADGRACLSKA